MTTQTLAHISNNAMYSATIVYALAMLAHVAEWAMARQLTSDPAPVRRSAVSAASVGAVSTVSAGAVGERVDATVGSGAAAGSAAGSAGGQLAGQPGGPGRVLPPPAPIAPVGPPSDDDVERSDRFGRIGFSLTVLGLVIHAVGVVTRGFAAQRVPWGSMYEFSITGSLAVVLAYVFLVRRYDVRWLGLLVTGFLVTVLGIAVILLYRPAAPLVPALHSYWLYIHVSAAAIAGGAYTVGALASVLYLMRSRVEMKAVQHPDAPRRGYLWRTPSAEAIDRVAYRVHAFAFPLWTFAVTAGAIWAQYAWGRFWGWDPKEVWAFITWVAYAAYLHARATAGWQGRAAAYVALFGYATFLFNFVGINLFGHGLHSYSGM